MAGALRLRDQRAGQPAEQFGGVPIRFWLACRCRILSGEPARQSKLRPAPFCRSFSPADGQNPSVYFRRNPWHPRHFQSLKNIPKILRHRTRFWEQVVYVGLSHRPMLPTIPVSISRRAPRFGRGCDFASAPRSGTPLTRGRSRGCGLRRRQVHEVCPPGVFPSRLFDQFRPIQTYSNHDDIAPSLVHRRAHLRRHLPQLRFATPIQPFCPSVASNVSSKASATEAALATEAAFSSPPSRAQSRPVVASRGQSRMFFSICALRACRAARPDASAVGSATEDLPLPPANMPSTPKNNPSSDPHPIKANQAQSRPVKHPPAPSALQIRLRFQSFRPTLPAGRRLLTSSPLPATQPEPAEPL
jgi:hypothetical protein